MTTLREAAERVFDALQFWDWTGNTALDAAYDELCEALASQTVPSDYPDSLQPVAVLMTNVQSGDVELVWNDDGFDKSLWYETELYTAPPQRQPLTDGDIEKLMTDTWGSASIAPQSVPEFARAIERAHGIGGEE
jgi:hypothetical protein